MVNVNLNDRLYYTGDMANCASWGTVVEVSESDVVLAFDDGRLSHIYPSAIGGVYQGHCSPRFVTEKAYRTYVDFALDTLRAAIAKAEEKGE